MTFCWWTGEKYEGRQSEDENRKTIAAEISSEKKNSGIKSGVSEATISTELEIQQHGSLASFS